MTDPFADILDALKAEPAADDRAVRIDPNRQTRTGIPEIVYAESKTPEDTLTALLALVEINGRSIASRIAPAHVSYIETHRPTDTSLTRHDEARMIALAQNDAPPPPASGRIAVISAGTSDTTIAKEAVIIAREMGCDVIEAHDVGVAGLHRLVGPLRLVVSEDVSAIVVAAGMDGALPTVIAGLVDVPVIGLPTSVGYGVGGDGESALHTMLQSCAPGLLTVNIDNGIGAGASAALIARQKRR